jgi:hypothetical protein
MSESRGGRRGGAGGVRTDLADRQYLKAMADLEKPVVPPAQLIEEQERRGRTVPAPVFAPATR